MPWTRVFVLGKDMVHVHLFHVFSTDTERERGTLVLEVMNLVRIDFAHLREFMMLVVVISVRSKVTNI